MRANKVPGDGVHLPSLMRKSSAAAAALERGPILDVAPNNYVDSWEIGMYDSNPSWNSYNPVSFAPAPDVRIGLPNNPPNCGFNLGEGVYSGWGQTITLWQ